MGRRRPQLCGQAWTHDGLPSSSSLGWRQGSGIEPREDLGPSPCPPCHVFITSKHQDLAPCPLNSSHCSPVGEPPPASVGDKRGGRGGEDPLYISCVPTPDINSLWFCFYFNFFVLIFLIRIFILSTFILKEFVLCIGGAGLRAEGVGPGEGQGSKGLPLPPCSQPPYPLSLFSSVFSNTVKY